MRKTMVLSVLLLSFAAGLVWAQFWKNYTDSDRQATSEAYWLAGAQYQKIGQPEVGGAFKVMAKEIYPALDPDAIADREALPSAAELLAQGRPAEIGTGAAGIPAGAVSSFFLRFLGALLDEDAAGVAAFLDGSVYLTKLPAEVTRADAQAAMSDFFNGAPLKDLQPSRVYNLDSIVVTPAPRAAQAAWGETYTLTVNAAADYSQDVSIWDMTQQFFIRRVSGNWYLFGYGPTMPPLTWTPQKAEPGVPQAPAAAQEADSAGSITEAFTACMAALLKKDAEGALGHMSQSIHFLRMRQSVTRDELRTTLQGYFDTADFKGAGASDVVDLDSIFVEPSASPVEEVTGDIYMLNVRSRLDLSAGIPFWSSYQRYYFVQEDGHWVIFAIL